MRKKIVAGNWKLNKNLEEGLSLASEIINIAKDELHNQAILVINPPFIHLSSLQKLIPQNTNIRLGSQNCYHQKSGAFTGEISAEMLKSVGVQYTIVGHSERREYFNETAEQLAQKVKLLLEVGITPIFCCGESLSIRESGSHLAFVAQQITDSLFDLSVEDIQKIVIAYEPIWAIGTGKTASSAQAQEMHAYLRNHLAQKYSQEIAQNISILYGGSCNPQNAKELFACADIDGGLIGGASLKSRDFITIAQSF
ncbi:MAG: triose-phosphate isomerase [Bacteroidetes bacterium]|nr:MAG: triose-phosphate isomerase [Bacteroidota bacterium]TAG88213.1 MAG: triose-phosphate isomerase [Bacteroidota bacterium]